MELHYQRVLFEELCAEDGLAVLAPGLGLRFLLARLLRRYCDPAHFVVVVNATAEEEDFLVSQLALDDVSPLPAVVNNEVPVADRCERKTREPKRKWKQKAGEEARAERERGSGRGRKETAWKRKYASRSPSGIGSASGKRKRKRKAKLETQAESESGHGRGSEIQKERWNSVRIARPSHLCVFLRPRACFLTLPSLFDRASIHCRVAVYASGGVVFVTSRIMVVDILSHRFPTSSITGIIVCHAER